MNKIVRTDSNNIDFIMLVKELDSDLNDINGEEQSEYDKHNVLDFIDTVVLIYKKKLPIGCGAFKDIGNSRAEIKRVYINSEHRGEGLSKLIINELEVWALERDFKNVVLETGKKQYTAISLYKSVGYSVIDNYEPYINLSNSVCMSKELSNFIC